MNHDPDLSDLEDEDDPDDNPIMRAYIQTLGPAERLNLLRLGIEVNFDDFEPLIVERPKPEIRRPTYILPVARAFSPDWLPPHPAVW